MTPLQLVLVLVLLFAPDRGHAHELQPGFLELTPLGSTDWRVTWRKPQVGGQPMPIDAVLPETCAPRRGPDPSFDGRAFISRWISSCPSGIEAGTIEIEGLDRTRTDVLVRYLVAEDDAPQSHRLTPGAAAFDIPPSLGLLERFSDYFDLGVDHILSGLDHLLFVFALVLLIRKPGPLIAAITSFTIAHSLSLAAATLGWIVVPAPAVEAIVALSIVVLAAELAQPPGRGMRLTERRPSTVAFLFGLLHGLGFASALLELGLPRADIPFALFAFNIGVEAGQLMFVAATLAAGVFLVRLLQPSNGLLPQGSQSLRIVAYLIGTVSAAWMWDRISGFLA